MSPIEDMLFVQPTRFPGAPYLQSTGRKQLPYDRGSKLLLLPCYAITVWK